MAINEVSGAQGAQPARRIETKQDQAGNPVNSIFEDRNGDGKLDLYQITTIKPSYDNCTHEVTYTDKDGDGYFDTVSEKITPHHTDSNGKPLGRIKTITEEYTEKNEATKIENQLNPPKQKMVILPNLKWN